MVCALDDLEPSAALAAGAKAANCARLRQAGFPVPNGFVVVATSVEAVSSLDLAEALRPFAPDTLFAVRSSASDEDGPNRSFAGIHQTLLNVPRTGILDAIRTCMASGNSEHANAYRASHGLEGGPAAIGVLVQEMVPAEVAGVAFTVNPASHSATEIVINASWGLGEAVVNGQADPDEFHVDRASSTIVRRRLGSKQRYLAVEDGVAALRATPPQRQVLQTLSEPQIATLADLLLNIEQEFGVAQDIEWCLVEGTFWVVQSRPITQATATYPSPLWSRTHPDIEWSRATALESLPDLPKPQVSQAHCELIERGVRGIAPELLAPIDELGPVARVVLGRLYFNVSQFKHMANSVGRPAHPVITAHGGASHPQDTATPALGLRGTLRVLPRILRLAGIWPPFQQVAWADKNETKRLDRLRQRDPRELSDDAVWAEVAAPQDVETKMRTGVLDASALLLAVVRTLCPRASATIDPLRYAAQAANKTNSSQEGLDLLGLVQTARREAVAYAFFTLPNPDFRRYREQLAGTRCLREFETFLQAYGHCSTFDKDWSLPRYREDPSPLLEIIRLHLRAEDSPHPKEIVANQQRELRAAWAAFNAAAGRFRGRLVRPLVWWALRAATQFHTRREHGRFNISVEVGESRPWHLALAERFVARGWLADADDYFYLTLGEVRAALTDAKAAEGCKTIVKRRRAEYRDWRAVVMPTVLLEADIAGLQYRAATAAFPVNASSMAGVGVSHGSVSAQVVVVRDPSEFAKMQPHAIIVTTATDPSWTPLFTLASGVIAEVGGMLSHSATLARELGLPAVTSVKDATTELKDGDLVHLDATNGMVHVLRRAQRPQPIGVER